MKTTARAARDGLGWFFVLTFVLSWAAWGIGIAAGMTNTTFPGMLLFVLGGSGPSIVGIILLYRCVPAPERKDYWKRVIDFKNIQPVWYGLILLGIPATFLLGIGLDALLGGPQQGYGMLAQIAAQPWVLFPVIFVGLIGGPLSEELGWRGFALERMARRWGLKLSSLILGLIWWAWHLPLFFFKGTTHYQWGLGSASFWIFLLSIVPLSIFLAWGYSQNNRSILSAVLIHFMYNFTLSLVYPVSARMLLISAIFQWLLTLGVVIFVRKTEPRLVPGATS